MSANGGVCGIPLRIPAAAERVRALLRPFYWLCEESGNADWQEETVGAWHAHNPTPGQMTGTYGTSQRWSLLDLDAMLRGEDEDLCGDPTLTFAEVVEDIDTRPWHYQHRSPMGDAPVLETWIQEVRWLSGMGGLGALAAMTVTEWAAELRAALDVGAAWSEETWT